MSRPCLFCYGPTVEEEGKTMPLTQDMLCEAHWQEEMDALAEIEAVHPDGHCTEVCGCMTLEQFKASLT